MEIFLTVPFSWEKKKEKPFDVKFMFNYESFFFLWKHFLPAFYGDSDIILKIINSIIVLIINLTKW